MHISELKKSNYLKKEDCGPNGILVTVKGVVEENIAKEGAPEEFKWCLHIEEHEKPMVLNSTNGQLIAVILGSENSDDWIGKRIVLYNEPGVTNLQGKVVGGIRVRAPRGRAAQVNAVPKPVPAAAPKPMPKPESVMGPAAAPCDESGEVADQDVPF